jgi:hypothetical protein
MKSPLAAGSLRGSGLVNSPLAAGSLRGMMEIDGGRVVI